MTIKKDLEYYILEVVKNIVGNLEKISLMEKEISILEIIEY